MESSFRASEDLLCTAVCFVSVSDLKTKRQIVNHEHTVCSFSVRASVCVFFLGPQTEFGSESLKAEVSPEAADSTYTERHDNTSTTCKITQSYCYCVGCDRLLPPVVSGGRCGSVTQRDNLLNCRSAILAHRFHTQESNMTKSKVP